MTFLLFGVWLFGALICLDLTGDVVAAWIAGTLFTFLVFGVLCLTCPDEPLSDADAVLYREKLEVE